MLPYYILMAVVLLAPLGIKDEKIRNKYIWIAFIAMFILMGLRSYSRIGYDSRTSYYNRFQYINHYDFSADTTNFLFFYVMKLISNLAENNYQWFLVIEAAFVCFSYGRLVKRHSVNPKISVLWFIGMLYFTLMFSALKQAFAMSILCFAYDEIINRRLIRFVVAVLIASCFHLPALVFLPAYWIAKADLRKGYLILLALLFAIVFVFRGSILAYMTSIYGNGEESYSGIDPDFLGMKVIIMVAIIVFAIIIRSPNLKMDREYTILLLLMGVASVFQTFCYYSNVFERLADYYYQFSILFMPMVFENREVRENETMLVGTRASSIYQVAPIVIYLFCTLRFLIYVSGDWHFSPFVFFWQ